MLSGEVDEGDDVDKRDDVGRGSERD